MIHGQITFPVSLGHTTPISAYPPISILPPVTPAVARLSDLPQMVTALIQNHPNWFLTILGLFTIGATIAVIEALGAAFPESCDPDGIDADDIR